MASNKVQPNNKSSKWYDIRPILSKNADFNLIVGQRGNGKTYGIVKFCLEDYKNSKGKNRFAYIRRWADDIKGFRAEQLLFPLQKVIEELFGVGYTVTYWRHKYYLVNADGEKVDIIGYCLALSEASHTKSVAYTGVKNILFDEFIQMAGERALPDEMLKFENTLSTIIRDRQDVKVFMAANTVSKFSPYFPHFALDINKIEQGEIVVKDLPLDDGFVRVALEYCEYNEEVGKAVSKYATSQMIKTGQWEIPPTDEIPSAKNEVVKEKLLLTMHEPDTGITVGMFLRTSRWTTLELDEVTQCYYTKNHARQFLVIKQVTFRSKYFHLTQDKSLDYHTYNDLDYMLRDILEQTGIDVEREIFMGRVFCDNMFTADYFNRCWQIYNSVRLRQML